VSILPCIAVPDINGSMKKCYLFLKPKEGWLSLPEKEMDE